MQQQDASLTKFINEAEQKWKAEKTEVYFKMKNGFCTDIARIL